jgi:hypothetical protein
MGFMGNEYMVTCTEKGTVYLWHNLRIVGI